MRKLLLLIAIIIIFSIPVSALELEAPPAPETVEKVMPETTGSFAADLLFVFKKALYAMKPNLRDVASIALSLIAVSMLVSILQNFSGSPSKTLELGGAIAISLILFTPSKSIIQLSITTIKELCEYGELLMPVLTAAMTAQGSITGATGLYAGTIVLNTIIMSCISSIIIPIIYGYLVLCIVSDITEESTLGGVRNFVKWCMTWALKILLYVFTSYMGITKVISGTTDAAAIKATKIAINGMVPVVGSIISDASDAILLSAGTVKNAVGIYGLVVLFAIWIGPFIEIGIYYIVLKLTAGICGTFGCKKLTTLTKDFSGVMGFLLAMTGTVCLMLLISTVCFMKGAT